MLRLEAVALYAGVNILLLLLLAYLVTRGRRTHKITLGDGGNEAMNRAIRAHANAAEYIPGALVGLLLLAQFNSMPAWPVHAAGISLTVGRLLHAIGLHTGAFNAARVIGTALTWLAYLIIGVGLLYAGITQQGGG